MKRDVVAVVDLGDNAAAALPTVMSLRQAAPGVPILAAGPANGTDALLRDAGATVVGGSLAAAADAAFEEGQCHVLLVGRPTGFPRDPLTAALAILEDDLRVSSVSFFASAASFLSFPYRHHPVAHQIESLDEEMVTRRLRTRSPELLPVPIPYATGPAVLLSAYALSALGPLAGDDPEAILVDFSLRARRRGFFDVLDPSTFCTRLFDVGVAVDDGSEPPAEAEELREESDSESSPLSVAHRVARTKVLGLRLLIDGSCLGPKEMGTQVQAVALIAALARRDDVAHIAVPTVMAPPPYAAHLAADPKIDARLAPGGHLAHFGTLDVAHQPFQPDGPIDLDALQAAAARTVVTLLDLIAYHGRSYHRTAEDWRAYRRRIALAAGRADGIVVPSDAVARHVRLERLALDDGRLFTVPLGTDHLVAGADMVTPAELLARDFVAGEFVLVLGANYSHKNRDLAVRTFRELRGRGFRHALVMVGASVMGSSRVLEAAASAGLTDGVLVIPDTSSEERNWLLRHASLVLYPSSAEGFGLVPFEAACFGTPTVVVPAGPLGWVAGLPVAATDWSPSSLADAAEALLADPDVAAAQVRATLAAGADQTWDAVAAQLVDVYRSVLSRPSVRVRATVAEGTP